MDEKIVDEILDELFSSFEKLETESAAILLLLKERGIASEEKLAPFIEEASSRSEVRWRAARVRMSALLKSAMSTPEQPAKEKTAANQDHEKKPPEEKKGPAEMNLPEDKEESEKNPKPVDSEPATESEKTAKPKSEDAQSAPERIPAEAPEIETKTIPQRSIKVADSEKTDKK